MDNTSSSIEPNLDDLKAKAQVLRQLHHDSTLLQMVNVWDVISARVVAEFPETKAIATAGHSIAASHGYPDGQIPLDLMIAAVGRIAAAVDVPVTADLDDGGDNPGETIRRAIGVGIVGANVEDRLRPLAESVERVEQVVAAAQAEGVELVLNARTDAFVRAGDRPVSESIADAVERGRAFLDAGATSIFVPGNYGEEVVQELVAGLGPQRLSVLAFPNLPTPPRLEELGVARVTYGPLTQRIALAAYQNFARSVIGGAATPGDIPVLN